MYVIIDLELIIFFGVVESKGFYLKSFFATLFIRIISMNKLMKNTQAGTLNAVLPRDND